jgi:hypothetical protein
MGVSNVGKRLKTLVTPSLKQHGNSIYRQKHALIGEDTHSQFSWKWKFIHLIIPDKIKTPVVETDAHMNKTKINVLFLLRMAGIALEQIWRDFEHESISIPADTHTPITKKMKKRIEKKIFGVHVDQSLLKNVVKHHFCTPKIACFFSIPLKNAVISSVFRAPPSSLHSPVCQGGRTCSLYKLPPQADQMG